MAKFDGAPLIKVNWPGSSEPDEVDSEDTDPQDPQEVGAEISDSGPSALRCRQIEASVRMRLLGPGHAVRRRKF